MRKEIKYLFFAIIAMGFFASFAFIVAQTSGNSGMVNLTIWDDVLPETGGSIKLSNYNINFYANYTNSSNSVLNSSQGNGNCNIRFNISGSWTSWTVMIYNETSFLWQYNRTFNYKGDHSFQSNCTSNYGNITVNDIFTITNSVPAINLTLGGSYIDFDGNTGTNDFWNCSEDILCTYNFSSNLTEVDANDVLIYGYNSGNTTLTNFSLNTTTSILRINVTKDINAGSKQIELTVLDSTGPTQAGILRVNITAVNDAPIFQTLQNWSFNMTQLFERVINITDEENNTPFYLNITFINCSLAEWSTRGNNCTLFTNSSYTFNPLTGKLNISFTPTRNDVGSYIINFTVNDSGTVTPVNASTTVQVIFNVSNINSAAYFTYICDNERSANENSEFTCWINATDIDEVNNLTFSSNYSWFKFNRTATNSITLPVNSTTGFNASAFVNFTATDSSVGNWSVNITILDTGSPVKRNSTIFWFYVANVNDSVTLDTINNVTAYTSNNYIIKVNATDDDLLIPSSQHIFYNETLRFYSNHSNVSISYSEISGTNKTQATITFNGSDFSVGEHYINI